MLKLGVPGGKNLCRFFLLILILFVVPSPGWSLTSQAQVGPASVTYPAAGSPISAFTLSEWNVPTLGAGPWGITVDQLGKIWFTENVANKLARYDPTNNNFTEWNIPGGGNPRYVFAKQVISGNSNVTRVYFTEYSSDKVGYFNSWNGTFYEWQLPTGSNPVGIYVDSDYTIWFTESGRDAVGRLSPATNQLTEWTLPGATTSPGVPTLEPWGIYVQTALTGQFANVTDRLVWFTELANNAVGRLQITNNQLILWDLNSLNIIPGLKYGPMHITVDSTRPGNVIFSDSTGDRISVLQNCGIAYPACTGYLEYALPSRTSIAKPTSVALDPSRGVAWFTEYNTGIIGYADRTSQGNPSTVPTTTACVIPPTAGSACASPAGYTITTVTPTITNNVLGVSSSGVPQPTATVPVFQGPINGITEYRLPNITARPNFVTLDYGGNIWFTESNVAVNRIGRMSIPYVFSLSVSPTTQTVNQGQSASYSVSVNLLGGTPLPIQLSLANASSSLSVGFTSQSGTPPFTSTLTVAATNSTPTGTYTMKVMATSGDQSKSSTITLTVQPPSFDFGMKIIGAGTVTTPQGEPVSLQIDITLSSGSSEHVTLTATGFPAKTTYSFTTASEFPPFTTTLNIQTDVDTPPGSYPITITGASSSGITHHPTQTPILQITEVTRDFNLTATANEVTLVQASRTDVTLTITSVGSFNGNVTLNGAFSPSIPGLTVTFSPSWVTPQLNGGSSQVTMEIVATRYTPGQTYQLTVTGTSTAPSRTHQITIAVRVSPCLIATAAFGSELAPEVQFLRTFRDQRVMRTFAGSNFMTVFNAWYYSFSPAVAQFEYSHATARMIIRAALYPLIAILHLSSLSYTMLASRPELAVLTTGIMASFFIGLVYVAVPISSLLWITKKQIRIRSRNIMKWVAAAFVPPIIGFTFAEAFVATWLMTIASTAIVLATLASAGVLGVSLMLTYIKRIS